MTDSRVRTSIIGVVALALFSALFARLWYLQVASNEQYAAAAESNSVRVLQDPPIRGRILDAKGRPLVDNRIANVLTVDRDVTGRERQLVVGRLAELLGVPSEDIEAKLDDQRVSPYAPVPIAIDVPYDVLAYVSEHIEDFPGVEVEPVALRRYVHGSLGAHTLGYIGEINEDELEAQQGSGNGDYRLGDDIGKAGIEQVFESDLRGVPGRERLEVDSSGRVLRTIERREPEPGMDVQVTLDLDVQRVVEGSLGQGILAARGSKDREFKEGFRTYRAPGASAIVLDVTDGSVVAMASYPTFDPNRFTNGIPTAEWQFLNDPVNGFPLLDRSVQGQYAPGSTWKLVTALGGLASGQIDPQTTINDRGAYEIGDFEFTNDGRRGYGRVDLARALTVSSDVFFYQIGGNLWPLQRRGDPAGDALQQAARALGFGQPTGIAVPNEASGRVPDAAWKQRIHDADPENFQYPEWLPGDNVQFAVGQGDVLATPIQLAQAYAAFGNGGTLFQPRLGARVLDPDGRVVRELAPTRTGTVAVPGREEILAGLAGVTADEEGTAFGAFAGFPLELIPVAGKTGTAQVQGKQNTSLFAAVAPANAPKYAVVVVVEEAGYGAAIAAPITRRILEGLYGLPLSTVTAVDPPSGN